jgi:hypothetical protein
VLFAVAVCLIGCCLVLLPVIVDDCAVLWSSVVSVSLFAAGSGEWAESEWEWARERHPLALMRVETGVIIKDLIVTSDQLFSFHHTLSPHNLVSEVGLEQFLQLKL